MGIPKNAIELGRCLRAAAFAISAVTWLAAVQATAGPTCTTDADCTDPSMPFCTNGNCQAPPNPCQSDTDCMDPALPICEQSSGDCVECVADQQCWGDSNCGGTCDGNTCSLNGADCFNDDFTCGGSCSATGTCEGSVSCVDNAATCGGTCTTGSCGGGTSCLLTESCALSACFFGCPAAPITGCDQASKSALHIFDNDDDTRDKVKLKLTKSNPLRTAADLGDPTTATWVNLCLYNQGSLIYDALVGPDPTLWQAIKDKGFKYKELSAAADGTQKILVKAGGNAMPKSTKIVWKGKGPSLPDPLLPLSEPISVVAQVLSSDGICVEDHYSSALKNVDLGKKRIFKAKQ